MNAKKMILRTGLCALPLLCACHSDRPYDDTSTTDRTVQPSPNYRSDYRTESRDYRNDQNYRTDQSYRDTSRTDTSAQPAYRDRSPAEHASSFSFNRVTGNMTTTVDANVDKVWSAAQDALNDLHFTTEEKKSENDESVIKAKTADKDSVKVTIKRHGEKMTDITVGVGTMGKESTADLVLQNIVDKVR